MILTILCGCAWVSGSRGQLISVVFVNKCVNMCGGLRLGIVYRFMYN